MLERVELSAAVTVMAVLSAGLLQNSAMPGGALSSWLVFAWLARSSCT
jgi:hypothetical protein